MTVDAAPQSELEEVLRRKVADLETRLEAMTSALVTTGDALSKTTSALATVTAERDNLRRAYELLKGQLELLRRRIFVAKAERIDTTQLEIEFAETKAKLDKLAQTIDATGDAEALGNASASELQRRARRGPATMLGGPRSERRPRRAVVGRSFQSSICPKSGSRSWIPCSKKRRSASASKIRTCSATGAPLRFAS